MAAPPNSHNLPPPFSLGPHDPLSAKQVARWIAFFVILGVTARTVRYLLRFPLWEDECFLSANLLDRGYAGLMGGLGYNQACPLGFLWGQLPLVKLFGFHEFSLRLFSFVCGLASLFLFRCLARCFLKGLPLVAAVGIFAVSYPGIRYSAEAKPYGPDLCLSLVLTTLAVAWWRSPEGRPWLWALACVVPACVAISYPAVFVGGGISLFVAWLIWARGDRGAWLPWIVYNAGLVGSFGLLFLLSAENQSHDTLKFMQNYWQEGFPPLGNPLKFAQWFLIAHTSDMIAYPFGGHRGGSILTAICCLVGLIALIRRREYPVLLLWLAPLGLTFLAAAMHRYPYGQMVKFQIYMAPVFCMLAGAGAALVVRKFSKSRNSLNDGKTATTPLPAAIFLTALTLVGFACMARDFRFPAKSAAVMRARDFARWFWFTAQFEGEVACLKTDLGITFSAADFEHGLSSMYLCNQQIYSSRHAEGRQPQWDRVAENWPLRCVEFHSARGPYDHAAHDRWLAAMQTQYRLVAQERYPFVLGERKDRPPRDYDYLEVYKFVPRPPKEKG